METTHGKVRGVVQQGTRLFRGIPYGGDTSGRNRFMPPTRPANWSGTRDCIDWGHIAPRKISSGEVSEYTRLVGWNNYRGGISEDCLNLNIWAPLNGGGNRAVMVAFHGGGFTSGSGNLTALEGDHLVRQGDVVVVTVNHRLGALGYTDLSASGKPEFAATGVAGMMDCVAALEWVRDNIANFGGDPGRVLIFGQSGGGAKCSALMCMPSAKGLFHRAAMQSGSTIRLTHHDIARKNAEALLAKLGVPSGDLSKLQAMPFEQIVDAQAAAGPVVDGMVIPRDPFDPDAPSVSASVPMIIGTCLEDQGLGMTDWDIDQAGLRSWVESQAPGQTDKVLAAYRKLYPEKRPFLIKAMIATDKVWRRNAVLQAERKTAQGGAPAYMYRWDWPIPAAGGKFGAIHGADLSMSFFNADTDVGTNSPQARRMAERLGSAYLAFAKTGDPNNPKIPHWQPYNATERPLMLFDNNTRLDNDPNAELRLLWDKMAS
ncbi:MAG: carboxylesterase/lipase family protein [Rhizomicrobium sp.]